MIIKFQERLLARATSLYKSHFLSVHRPSIIRVSIFSWLLIGGKYECYIVEEVIEVDELDEGNISAAARKQDK